MNYKTILFDFDGTLADTLPICFYSFQKVFHKYDNRDLPNEEIINMFGPSETGIIQQNLMNREGISEAIEDYYFYYNQAHMSLVKLNKEIVDMLNEVNRRGIQFGIVTGKARRSYEISINHLFKKDMFKVSITGDEVINPKPHPEGILLAMKLLNASAEETLFVGDSNADIEAGIRANVKTVGVNWLNHSHGSRFIHKPDYEYSSIAKFINDLFS
jgi:pyrophosphatase PpaX